MFVLSVVQVGYFGRNCETVFPTNTRKTHLEVKHDSGLSSDFNHGEWAECLSYVNDHIITMLTRKAIIVISVNVVQYDTLLFIGDAPLPPRPLGKSQVRDSYIKTWGEYCIDPNNIQPVH